MKLVHLFERHSAVQVIEELAHCLDALFGNDGKFGGYFNGAGACALTVKDLRHRHAGAIENPGFCQDISGPLAHYGRVNGGHLAEDGNHGCSPANDFIGHGAAGKDIVVQGVQQGLNAGETAAEEHAPVPDYYQGLTLLRQQLSGYFQISAHKKNPSFLAGSWNDMWESPLGMLGE
jgi:hypothetical protein